MPTRSRPSLDTNSIALSDNLRRVAPSPNDKTSLDIGRGRSLSSASTTSSYSVSSPVPSSNNASTSSVNLIPAGNITGRGVPSLEGNNLDGVYHRDSLSPDEYSEAPQEFVMALHDFVPQPPNPTCLTFRAGQMIHVLNRDPSGWWDGELKGRRGWFPSNYVQKETFLMAEDELHPNATFDAGHSHAKSQVSVASWDSSSSRRHNATYSLDVLNSDNFFTDGANSCPPLLLPLYRNIHVLQNVIRSRNVSHYQPAAAMIVSSIRSILTATDCLERDAPNLKRSPKLTSERKLVLSELSTLVSVVKDCSDETSELDEDEREAGEERILRLAGQFFARVRRFLAVAVQCGIEIPEEWPDQYSIAAVFNSKDPYEDRSPTDAYSGVGVSSGHNPNYVRASVELYDYRDTRQNSKIRDQTITPDSMSRLRINPDAYGVRNKASEDGHSDDSYTPMISEQTSKTFQLKQEKYFGSTLQHPNTRSSHRSGHKSISSTSSFSSSSSFDSVITPATSPFPSGPCTSSEILVALRVTHDNLLSTVAAFIGGIHSYSRFAHASSTGHLYDLVRQIVELVCKVLTIVEATLKQPGIPASKIEDLKFAKERLYETTNELPPVIRKLTSNEPSSRSEEEEKQDALRLATDTVKAGSDCTHLVKSCLSHSQGDERFHIVLPNTDSTPVHRRVISRTTAKTPSMEDLQEAQEQNGEAASTADEDMTMKPQNQNQPTLTVNVRDPSSDDSNSVISVSVSVTESDEETAPTSSGSGLSVEPKPRSDSLRVNVALASSAISEPDLPSPVSSARTDGDNTTWDGHQKLQSLEDKLIHGELPSVPALPEITALSKCLSYDYAPEDVAYNSEGHLVGATWEALVEKMTPHDSIVDPAFAAIFLLTFRLFSSATRLADTLIERYNLVPPVDLNEDELGLWKQRKMMPVRLRVSNFIKLWLETYWRPEADDDALPILLEFVKDTMSETFRDAARRIEALINARSLAGRASLVSLDRNQAGDRMRDAGLSLSSPIISPSDIPRPIMTKTLLGALRSKVFASIAISDFDTLELARQLTILECSLYCAVTREEVLEMGQSVASPAQNAKAVSSLSTAITGWVAESILNEPDTKKRTVLVKFFIKLADRCVTLNNFSSPRSILAALDSSTIARLSQTWIGLPQKSRLMLESLRKLADHARNYSEYRSRLRNTSPPAVPFLGLYLTDLTFCREGNSSHRVSPVAPNKELLNFNKYHKLARIVQDMQRFQLPYNLKEIPEVQEYLQFCFEKSKHHGDLEDLYRRSLMVEPKQPADASTPNGELKQLFSWTIRGQPSQATQS